MARPKDLKPPFAKNAPTIVVHDRVWYVPPRADLLSFTFPGWSSDALFGNTNKVCVEFCSGNGDWIIEKAQQFPEKNWLAVEKRFDRVKKIWSKTKNRLIPNLVIACGEGLSICSSFFPSNSVNSIFVNFPDPWPKNRHAKHRIISTAFLREVCRVLQDGGSFVFVTDDNDYSNLFLSMETEGLMQTLPHPGYSFLPQDYGSSFFANLFIAQQKPIYYHRLSKIQSEPLSMDTLCS